MVQYDCVPRYSPSLYITEEALKRQQAGYGQVQFNYDGRPTTEEQPTLPQHGPEEAEEPDDPFEPHPDFEIPRHIEPVSDIII